jgi:hypothetical protein
MIERHSRLRLPRGHSPGNAAALFKTVDLAAMIDQSPRSTQPSDARPNHGDPRAFKALGLFHLSPITSDIQTPRVIG